MFIAYRSSLRTVKKYMDVITQTGCINRCNLLTCIKFVKRQLEHIIGNDYQGSPYFGWRNISSSSIVICCIELIEHILLYINYDDSDKCDADDIDDIKLSNIFSIGRIIFYYYTDIL